MLNRLWRGEAGLGYSIGVYFSVTIVYKILLILSATSNKGIFAALMLIGLTGGLFVFTPFMAICVWRSSNRSGRVGKILGKIFALIIVLVNLAQAGSMANLASVTSDVNQTATQALSYPLSIEDQKTFLTAANADLPQSLDEDKNLNSISIIDNKIIYEAQFYKFSENEINEMYTFDQTAMKQYLADALCQSELRGLMDGGYQVAWDYTDKSAKHFLWVEIGKEDCSSLKK